MPARADKEVKQYYFTKEEQTQINARRNLLAYLVDLVEKDILRYVDEVVKPRLGLSKEVLATVNEDLKSFTVAADSIKAGRPKKNDQTGEGAGDETVAPKEPRKVASDKKKKLASK